MSKSNQVAGVNISGVIGSVGGDITGGNKLTTISGMRRLLDEAFSPVLAAVEAAPASARPLAEKQLQDLKSEVEKGEAADQGLLEKLAQALAQGVPGTAALLLTAFSRHAVSAILGPATTFILEKLLSSLPGG